MRNRLMIIAVGILMVCLLPLTASAQNNQEWQSTSAMQSSGSVYTPQVTAVGSTSVASEATTTENYAPAKTPGQIRRGNFDPVPEGGTQENTYPVGDAVLPLMLMALAFGGVIYLRRKKAVRG